MTSRNGIPAQREPVSPPLLNGQPELNEQGRPARDESYHCRRAFLSSFARSRPPKIRPQKPRFFLGGSVSVFVGGGGGGFAAAFTAAAGGRVGSICTATGLSVGMNTL